jgi:hypothetical protein
LDGLNIWTKDEEGGEGKKQEEGKEKHN